MWIFDIKGRFFEALIDDFAKKKVNQSVIP